MPVLLPNIRPVDLGLPEHFPSFRNIQREIAEFCLVGPTGDPADIRRFMACSVPAGGGKSLAAHAVGVLSGMRYGVLTATRALEDQQEDDNFPCVDIRGRVNYDCVDIDPLHPESTWDCEQGRDEKECKYADTTLCTYGARLDAARRANFVSNYMYFGSARSRNRGALERVTNPIDLLICDEAHKIPSELSRLLSTRISHNDLFRFAGESVRAAIREGRGAEWGRVGSKWIDALLGVWSGAAGRMGDLASGYDTEAAARRASREYRKLERLCDSLDRICTLADVDTGRKEVEAEGGGNGNWIWVDSQRGVRFECIWPARYAERYLWTGVKRIILMSATLRPKALVLSGVPKKDYWFNEWGRVFPAANGPVVWIPTGRMGMKAGEDGFNRSVARIDEIIDKWGHLKGIIHTPSYKLAERYQGASKYGRAMMLNAAGDARSAVETADRFRRADAPCVLVSPSFSTGWDFPDSQAEWQIIPKLPFADRTDPVFQARDESDPEYANYETMQQLVQACGRGTRHPEDKCMTMVTDDAIGGFRKYAKIFAPRWWTCRDSKNVPSAPRD